MGTKLTLVEGLPEAEGVTWTKTTHFEGTNPLYATIFADQVIVSRIPLFEDGAVAQLGERLSGRQKAVGSTPISSTEVGEGTNPDPTTHGEGGVCPPEVGISPTSKELDTEN